jgi:OOP family OmpA-OmpF porin
LGYGKSRRHRVLSVANNKLRTAENAGANASLGTRGIRVIFINHWRTPARKRTALHGAVLALLITLLGAGSMLDARAQSESVEEMIQQLQGNGKGKRTRSLRNLNIEPALPGSSNDSPGLDAGSPAAEDSRPSISLLIHFDFDSASVRPESMPSIEKLTRAIGSAELSNYRFAIEGHTDSKGRADYNLRLSERRARRVKEILVQNGVDPNRLYALGKGSTEPANRFDPSAPENRRVKIVNLD